MFFLAKVGPEIYAVLFPLLCVFIPVVLLAIFVVVKKIVKNAKRANKMKPAGRTRCRYLQIRPDREQSAICHGQGKGSDAGQCP